MKKEVKTKMTLDKLATIMAGSFSGMEERLTKSFKQELTTQIEESKQQLTTKIEGLGKRIDDFAETKSSKIEHKKLITRVEFIEQKLEINR